MKEKMMMKLALTFLIVGMTPLSSQAQFMRAEGEFLSKSVELKTIVLDPENGVLAASTTVTRGACSGTISGIGRITGKLLQIEPYVKVEGGEQCVLQVNFDSKWKSAKISETTACSAYRGASCAWEGQEVKRKGR
jgi:hypothetical protein